MEKKILCKKLNKELPALDRPPMPGPKGIEIMETVSSEAWELWKTHQTMLINEYRLNALDNKAQSFLQTEMEKFFFGNGSDAPSGYHPEDKN